MSENKVGNCPKCGRKMSDGRYLCLWGSVWNCLQHIIAEDGIQAYCKCGFILSKYLPTVNERRDGKYV